MNSSRNIDGKSVVVQKSEKNVGQILGVSDFSLRNLHLSIICFIDLKIQNMFLLNLQQLGDNFAIIHQIFRCVCHCSLIS